MGIFRRKKNYHYQDTTEVEEPKPEHWSTPIFRSLHDLFDENPDRFFFSEATSAHMRKVLITGRPDIELKIDLNDFELLMLSPERIPNVKDNREISTQLGEKIYKHLHVDNRQKLGQFISEYIQGKTFSLLPSPKRLDENTYLALRRCSDEWIMADRYIWFRSSSDATMVKLSMESKN